MGSVVATHTHTKNTMYTAQRNSNGNIIVCKGDTVRNSYSIIAYGSYNDCMKLKFGA